jgi:hypothetical protein
VKSPFLHLVFSSSYELEESSLEKSKSLKAAHARDMIFWNFFFLLSPKRFFFLLSPLFARVIMVAIVILVGRVKLFPLGVIGDEVSGVATLKAAPR